MQYRRDIEFPFRPAYRHVTRLTGARKGVVLVTNSPDPASADRGRMTSAAASGALSPLNGKQEPDSAERLAYSIDEAARLTGLSRDLLYDQMRRGNLTYVKVGRRRLITRHHLQQFLGDATAQ